MTETDRRHRARSALVVLLGALVTATTLAAAPAAKLELRKGDRIAIIGNTLAERMQHDGWLETLIQSRFPELELSFRNFGFSADEVAFRQRSAGFGSPDDYLRGHDTDVIFAFFGFNESFAGREGLEKFEADLGSFITDTLGKQYNGESAPRLVIFSPIAHEDLGDPNLPDGSENNERLALYTKAMARVSEKHDVPFVDIFTPTLEAYARSTRPLTLNGIHLLSNGNRIVARIIDSALFGDAPEGDTAALEKLRRAVTDKNFFWFHRYRTTDGFNVYGGRSGLRYTDGISNRDVLQREMEILEAMTALRTRRIWAIARGGDLQVDDGATPEFIPVKTNKPGPLPDGRHVFLSGEQAIEKMKLHDGMQVSLFASEEFFPELVNPVQMAFDTRGRLWVAVWPNYPHWKPKDPMDDALVIFEDRDGDGRADRSKIFVDDLHDPTGFEFWKDGVLVAQGSELFFMKDIDGDDRVDVSQRVLHGLGSEDTHHSANSFVLDPGGALYFQEGTFHRTQIETPYGPVRNRDGCVWRFEPRTWKVDRFVPVNFANPHGHVFDRWGQNFIHDGTGAQPFHAALFSGHIEFPAKHPKPPQVYRQRTRPCPGTEILSSRLFPDELQGNLLVANVIGFLGILQYEFQDSGSSFGATEVQPIIQSSDPNFRPSDLEIGPDGAIWFVDWHNPIIGHMQHHIRDPIRDHSHGRIYRITATDRELLQTPRVAGESIERLLDVLREHEDRVRYRARIELSGRDTTRVIAAAKRWITGLDPDDPQYQHDLLEGLWVHQLHNVVDVALLERVLGLSDFRARAAATRVLCYWRDRVPNALGLLKKLAADEHPRVRLEAVRAASFFTDPAAVEVPLISAEHPTDQYLDFVRNQTMRALEPHWKRAIAEGKPIPVTSDAGARFFLSRIGVDELLKMKPTRAVYLELLDRPNVREEIRRDAVAGLARLESRSELDVLIESIGRLDGDEGDGQPAAIYELARLLTARAPGELAARRDALRKLALEGRLSVTRQIGFVALILAEVATGGGVEATWKLGTGSLGRLRDLVSAVPLIPDASLRAALYQRIEPLLHALPEHLAPQKKQAGGTLGRYVRIELPGRGTLTLAEVEVYSGGRNVARGGKASQKNTGHGGDARRAIDGNTSGSYGDGGQTHTRENTRQPWWELDLGEETPIDAIVVYNRTEGDLGRRLDGFTIRVLDAQRQAVFVKQGVPAPAQKVEFDVGGGGAESLIRRAAIEAVTSVRGKEEETFKTLARFVREDIDRVAAVRALQRIPAEYWADEEIKPLADSVVAHVRDIPTADRTSHAALDALQLGEALAARLPAEEARTVRAELGELGVRIIRIGTLPHQMLYDRERFVVEAGKAVEVIFENNDIMPHNLVITKPGALVEIGVASEEMATQPGALERHYVPPSDKVLWSTRLLQPRESDRLSFNAPASAGVYPYVCTYPGHWRRMFGAMYVVEDLDAYLADPEGYLAEKQLPIADEMLEFRRPRTEWTLADLAPAFDDEHARSFGNGKQMFEVASCASCHKVKGVGAEFGPNLEDLDPKYTRLDIVRSLLEPSEKINEKYVAVTILTKQGRVVVGLVVEETPQVVKVVENPLASTEPVVIEKSQILRREKSPTSIMPKGLLDRLTREEILDLVAYIEARGDRNHAVYTGGHHDH